MRRYAFLILFVLVLVVPFGLRAMMGVDQRKERPKGTPQVVVITSHLEGIRREFQDGFSRWLKERGEPDVFLDFRNFGGGSSDIVNYFNASKDLFDKTGSYSVDLVWGGGDDLFARQLKVPGVLQRYDLPPDELAAAYPTPDIAGTALYDPDRQWYGTALGSFGIVYNKDVLRHLGLPEPKRWEDLADPRYRGWIVLADPTRSASAKTAFMVIVERAMVTAWEADQAARATNALLKAVAAAFAAAKPVAVASGSGAVWLRAAVETASTAPAALSKRADEVYQRAMDPGWADGMGLIRRICANCRVFADASASVPSMVGRGDAAAGMVIDFYGRTQVQYVGDHRVGYVEPAGATVANPDPIALVKGAPNRVAAELFIRYVLSEPGQKIWAYRAGTPGGPTSTTLRRLPIRRSLYEDPQHFADKTNPFAAAGSFNTKKDRTGTFSIVGEMIQASAVDLLPELIATQDAIRSVKDPAKAAALEARLGTFPFGQAEALKRMRTYQFDANGQKTVPLERLRMMREWTGAFRDEYAKIRAEAKQ